MMFNSDENKDKIENMAQDAKDSGAKLRDSAVEVGQAVKEQMSTSGKEALVKSSEMKDQVTDWVSDNPLKSIGIAFLAGWLYSKK